jgi:hypothetical protein
MPDGNPQQTASIHLAHLAEEIGTMIRPPLQEIKLPLMDHFMSQSTE